MLERMYCTVLNHQENELIERIDRYYGRSSPYDALTTKNLQYLTLNETISDVTHFAMTVNLPFDDNGKSNAGKAVSLLSKKLPWKATENFC